MKCDCVWVSSIKQDSTLVQTNLNYDRDDPARKAIKEGKDPNPEDLPLTVFAKVEGDPLDKLPPLFDGGGAIAISAQLAAPLLKFDLGRTLVLPTRILLGDRKTEVYADRGYYLLPRWHVFGALAPEVSPKLRPSRYGDPPDSWSLPWEPEDGDVAVHKIALDGPAIWHDPKLMNGIFFNGQVVDAIRSAGVARYWQLTECRIVD